MYSLCAAIFSHKYLNHLTLSSLNIYIFMIFVIDSLKDQCAAFRGIYWQESLCFRYLRMSRLYLHRRVSVQRHHRDVRN